MSSAAGELAVELSAWCESYVEAFSAYDAQGIERHWAFPALIIHDGNRVAFKTPEHFTQNTAALLGFYQRQGVARAERELVSCVEMGAEVAAMQVRDCMRTASGDPIAAWQAAYVMQRLGGSWRAVCAVADGEAAAWKARGTPLGS